MIKRTVISVLKNAYCTTKKDQLIPIITDVSLRDGLQCLPHNMRVLFDTTRKEKIFREQIMLDNNVQKVEIGSIVSANLYPIFADTMKLYKRLANDGSFFSSPTKQSVSLYVLVPNKKGFGIAINHGITNFSFITSVSDKFQQQNTNKTINQTKRELHDIFQLLYKYNKTDDIFQTKIYISCVTECPIAGKISLVQVVSEILDYALDYPHTEICLSDTCGSLKPLDFQYIIMQCILYDVNIQNISLHLHVDHNNLNDIEEIIGLAQKFHMNKFDVSLLDYGGCNNTLSIDRVKPNLNYQLLSKMWK